MDQTLTLKVVDIGICAAILRFTRKHRRVPGVVRVHPEIIDMYFTKEKQLNSAGYTFEGIRMVADDKLKPNHVEVSWLT